MSMKYIRDTYGVNAFRGAPIVFDGKPGRIVCAKGQYLRVMIDGERQSRLVHPTWHMHYGKQQDRPHV